MVAFCTGAGNGTGLVAFCTGTGDGTALMTFCTEAGDGTGLMAFCTGADDGAGSMAAGEETGTGLVARSIGDGIEAAAASSPWSVVTGDVFSVSGCSAAVQAPTIDAKTITTLARKALFRYCFI